MGAVIVNTELPLDESRDRGAAQEAVRRSELSRNIHQDRAQPGQIPARQPPWTAAGRPRCNTGSAVRASCGPPTAHAARIYVCKAGYFSR
jgi:hypothetical protein